MSKRWLIYRHGGIGDTVLLSPLVQQIRSAHPDDRITIVGHPERAELLCGDRLAHECIASDSLPLQSLWHWSESLPSELQAFLDSFATIIWFAGKPSQGLEERLRVRADQRVRVVEALPDPRLAQHVVSYYLAALDGWEETSSRIHPTIALTEDESRAAQDELAGMGWDWQNDVILGVHVGAGGVAKRTPLDAFFRVFRRPKPGERTLVLVTKGPADGDAVDEFCEHMGDQVNIHVLEERPLREMAALVSCCKRFVGNDSGVTHIAAAVGVPTDVFFVGSDPEIWAPLGEHIRVHDLRNAI